MSQRIRRAVCLLGVVSLGLAWAAPVAAAGKYAVILQAGKEGHEGSARAAHAFLYARELKEHGHEVVLIFDGAGTEWAEELSNPQSTSFLKSSYEVMKAQGIVEIICDYCASAFKVKAALAERGLQMLKAKQGSDESLVLLVEYEEILREFSVR